MTQNNECGWQYVVEMKWRYDPDEDLETQWDEIEDELHAKADRRKKKKETMPMDGRGLVVNNVNRKYKKERSDKS